MRRPHTNQFKAQVAQELLYAETGRLTTELTWLKEKVVCLPRAERLALVERE